MTVKHLRITANDSRMSIHKDDNTFDVYAPALLDSYGKPIEKTPLEKLLSDHFGSSGYFDPFLPNIDQEYQAGKMYGFFLCLSTLGLMDGSDLEYVDDFLRYGGSAEELGFCNRGSR